MLLLPSPEETMKTVPAILILAIAMAFSISALGQGFGNLDFESAYGLPANPGSGSLVPVTNALPGWTASAGGPAYSEIYYVSNYSRVSGSVLLEGGSLALSGNLSVGLLSNGSISQTGQVPSNAESLEFEGEAFAGPDSLQGTDLSVVLGGQALSYSLISEGPSYSVYGANIPVSMDGQLETLVFGCQGVGAGNVLLDNIEFLPTVVPEPAEWAVLGVGMLAFGFWRGKRVYLDRIHRIVRMRNRTEAFNRRPRRNLR
jgi:hypothetical protein